MKNQCLIWQYYISWIKYCANILLFRGGPEISFEVSSKHWDLFYLQIANLSESVAVKLVLLI